ncbi:predicted protein [Aspergillus terreus NIH2624]|uniref:Uncharacterized protein n=1 Tax=Aspergillus terreus (strain NIH 2624 / FGSC A1156) TaxID=341663 RepID=Q0CIH2_ASPTN|nr:uncharacterized protein ATEG_06512 [Aspergillus terreus NIH2624]EAU33056.1 predicted protein [Aspergillus terreus NIH2624]
MVALSTVVAVAVVAAVVVIVGTVIVTVVYVKKRQDRLSLAVVSAGQGYAHGLQNFPTGTLTSLTREEGSCLRQHGQLPYGRHPSEWGLLTSHETLPSPIESEPLSEKRALRRSFSWSRSKRQPKRPRRGSSLTPLKESNKELVPPTGVRGPKEEVSVSAVEGVLELPTETTPRQTPERDDDTPAVDATIRPISADGQMYNKRERSSGLFPLFEDSFEGHDERRSRGGSITMQTPGAAPEQPAPPPPVAYPPNRFRLSKNDSARFSTLSLETADSSILDETRYPSGGLESVFASPALPPCPTFTPYSANDVGRIEYDGRSFAPPAAFPAPFTFPASPSRDSQRQDRDRAGSPRRSQTARSPSHSVERASPPRRSESFSTSHSPRHARYSTQDSPPIHVAPLNVPRRNSSLLRQFSQMQRHSVYFSHRRDGSNGDPFYSGGTFTHPQASARRSNGFLVQDGLSKAPLPSALKNGSGPRKGHRRQNCVRISIHPPITFGGPTFSPMAEEPEELEELATTNRGSLVRRSDLTLVSPLNSSVSSVSGGRYSYQDASQQRHSAYHLPPYGQHHRAARNSRPSSSYRNPSSQRRHRRTQSADAMPTSTTRVPNSNRSSTNTNPHHSTTTIKSLPDLLTSLPPTTVASLSSTPSPEKKPPVWMAPPPPLPNNTYASSPTTYENASPGSPRRSAVKGPRNQPGKSTPRSSVRSIPPDDGFKASSAPTGGAWGADAGAQSMSRVSGMSTDSLHRAKSVGASTAPGEPRDPHSGSMQSRKIMPIWEDAKLERHPTTKSTVSIVSQVDGPAELQGDVQQKRTPARKSRQFTTPKKAIGLGIGAATPGSLYDVDGFLKE